MALQKKPRGVKVQTEETGTSGFTAGEGSGQNWKFAPSRAGSTGLVMTVYEGEA